MTLFSRALALAWVVASCFGADAIGIHPDNLRYFLFRGKPLVLITATEHYGSVINRPFDYIKYLDDAAAKGMTLTRTFLLFRELQSARNPSSPAKPESPDFIAPFPRTGPGKALDGEPAYDLDQWNPEYFERLRRFLQAASDKGIIVELTLFSNSYAENTWALNPFRAANNKQHVSNVEWPEYTSLKDGALVERQAAYARKIIQETSSFDNVYYEICNEPGGAVSGHIPPSDVDEWQEHIGEVMRSELQKLNRPHLVAGQEAFAYKPKFRFPLDKTFGGKLFDIVNVHPLPDVVLRDRAYQMGNFMSKELMLSEVAEFCRAAYNERKPVVLDEDNAASMYRDVAGWTIHRKRAWTAVLSGSHYDYIDFSITVGSESGTTESRKMIRSWMKNLSEFIHSFDFIHAKPASGWIAKGLDRTVVSGLEVSGQDYVAYLADAREVTDPNAGRELSGPISVTLPDGKYELRLYSPISGSYSPSMIVNGGTATTVNLPRFQHDLVLRATRM